MRLRLKKILTWTNMSAMVIAIGLATPTSISAGSYSDFGFGVYRAQQKEFEASMSRQLTCLARNVWYEAGGESFKGQLAVAQVTVNRSRSGLFPKDLCDVVAQHTVTDSGAKVCQFSWYCDKTKNKNKIISKNNDSYVAARKVLLEGHKVEQIDKNVYYFHNTTVDVTWPHKVATQIGNHIFYKKDKK